MKRNYKILLAIVLLSATLFAFNLKSRVDSNQDKDKLLLELLTFVLEKGHYSPASIDDDFSKGVYKDYVQALDPSKRFFLQSDIDEFSKFETELDDQLINKDLTFFNLSYDRLMKRMEESKKIYEGIMNVPLTIQSMRVLTPIMIKRLMQKTLQNLPKDGESRSNCRHFPL